MLIRLTERAMRLLIITLLVTGYLILSAQTLAQNKPTTILKDTIIADSKQNQDKASSFLEKILTFFGISATSENVKGQENVWFLDGQIWKVSLNNLQKQRISDESNFRSPICLANNREILAIQNDEIVKMGILDRKIQKLVKIKRIIKLIGFSKTNPDLIALLRYDNKGTIDVCVINMQSGDLEAIPYNPDNKKEKELVDALTGVRREYGEISVFVRELENFMASTKWTDVFLKVGEKDAINLTNGKGISSTHPALSYDQKFVVYIRVEK